MLTLQFYFQDATEDIPETDTSNALMDVHDEQVN